MNAIIASITAEYLRYKALAEAAIAQLSETELAMPGAGQPGDLQLHQPVRREADHLAQQIGIGTLRQKRAKGDHLVGHRRILGSVEWLQPNPTEASR